MPVNGNLFNKLNNMFIFNNLKLKFKNGLIFKVADTNVNWLKGFKSKLEKISHKGLANSYIEQSILTNYTIKLVNNVNEKIENL